MLALDFKMFKTVREISYSLRGSTVEFKRRDIYPVERKEEYKAVWDELLLQ